MSSEVQCWAIAQKTGDPVTKAVLTALTRWAKPDGSDCWPGLKILADAVEVSERTIQRHLNRLEELDLIRRIPRQRKNKSLSSNQFVFNGFWGWCQIVTTPTDEPGKTGSGEGQADKALSPGGDACVTRGGDNCVTPIKPVTHVLKTKSKTGSLSVREGSGEGFCGGATAAGVKHRQESWEASQFRSAAQEILGPRAYDNLLDQARISFSDGDICVHVASETLRTLLDQKGPLLRKALQPLGTNVGLRVLSLAAVKSRAPDAKVADALKQLNAIRGGRVAGAAHQAGGHR